MSRRLKSLAHLPPDVRQQQPLFTYTGLGHVKVAIDRYWSRIADTVAHPDFYMDPGSNATLPRPGEINDLLSGLFADEPDAELKRACARLRLPPYCLGDAQTKAMRIVGGEIFELQAGLYVPLRIVGRNDGTPHDSADNDWVRIFKPQLDVLSAHGTQPVPNGPFIREGNDTRSGGWYFHTTLASQTMAALTTARPELAIFGGDAPSDAMEELAAATMLAAGAHEQRLGGSRVLKVADVGADGSVAFMPELSGDAKHAMQAWKQLCERGGKRGDDPLFRYADPGIAKAAAMRHQRQVSQGLDGAVARTAGHR